MSAEHTHKVDSFACYGGRQVYLSFFNDYQIWIIIKIISGFGRLFSKVLEKVIGIYSSFCTFMQVFFHDLFLKSIRLLCCFQVTLSIL